MALALTTICDSIAAQVITGVTIKDIDGIPEGWDTRVPVMFPRPIDFVTDMLITRDTFGSNATAKKTITYTLHYTFLYAPVGSGRIGFDKYAAMVTLAMQILDKFDATTLGGSLQSSVDALAFGPTSDPSGNLAHGCEFQFFISEFIN